MSIFGTAAKQMLKVYLIKGIKKEIKERELQMGSSCEDGFIKTARKIGEIEGLRTAIRIIKEHPEE